jgi:hypothetical protein
MLEKDIVEVWGKVKVCEPIGLFSDITLPEIDALILNFVIAGP